MQKKTMVVLVLLALVAALPQVLQVKYFIHLAVLAMLWAMVAQGTNFIQGYAGYVSIVQGGFMGVGAYSSAWLSMNTGLPVWLAFVAAPLCTAVVALCVGYPSLRVKGHYFAIVTMAFNMVIFIFLVNAIGLTGGESGLGRIPAPPGFTLLGQEGDFQNRAHYYYLVLLALVCSSGLGACGRRSAKTRCTPRRWGWRPGATSYWLLWPARSMPALPVPCMRTMWASSIRRRSPWMPR